jgi:hypothetical protein
MMPEVVFPFIVAHRGLEPFNLGTESGVLGFQSSDALK